MNRTVVCLLLTLVVAGVASGGAQTTSVQRKLLAQPQTAPLDKATQKGEYTISNGRVMEAFSYTLRFTQPNGQDGGLMSGQAFPNLWNGMIVDRSTTPDALSCAGNWDSVTEGTQIELTIPGQDIESVRVTFDPNTIYNDTHHPITQQSTYMPQSVCMIPDENGQLYRCVFPISFAPDNGASRYAQLFCVIQVTFRNGNSCDIGCALAQKI